MTTHPQKILSGRYQVVPRSIILLIRNGEVLLQKAPENKKIFPGFYNGIGGHIEQGEDVLEGARRELKEEAGIECADLQLAGMVMIDVHPDTGILMFVFSGETIIGDLNSSDEGTLHWVDINRLSELPVVEDIQELVSRIEEFKLSGRQFFGKYLYDDQQKRITSWQQG